MDAQAIDLFRSFAEELNPERLQRKFLETLLKLQNVTRGSIWIKRENRYLCIEAAGYQSDNIMGVSISSGKPSIVGWVIENGVSTIADPKKDGRHYRELEEGLAVKSSLILCLPLFMRENKVYGAVQIIDTDPTKRNLNLGPEYLKHVQDLVNICAIALSNAILFNKQLAETQHLKHALKEIQGERPLIGESAPFLKVRELITSYGRSDFPILITGESGTGKDIITEQIHRLSARRKQPFLVQNCSAIPETLLESELFGYKKGAFTGAVSDKIGLFEAANDGTVLLDEIGDMPPGPQAALLRVIENSEVKPLGDNRTRVVNVRIIAATNKNIQEMVARKQFREDLYYRLSVLPMHLPPLRKRREDIPLLLTHLLKFESLKLDIPIKKLSSQTIQLLYDYPWYGNIREMENLIRYLLVVIDKPLIDTSDLPPQFINHQNPAQALDNQSNRPVFGNPENSKRVQPYRFGQMTWQEMEIAYAGHLLEKHKGNITQAANSAGLNRSTFASRMRRLGLTRNNSEPSNN